MEGEEAYNDEKLVEEISASLLNILKKSPRPELTERCLEKNDVEDRDELKEMIEKKLRTIFRKPPKKKKPVSDTPQKKPGEEGKKEVKKEIKEEVVEQEEEEEDEWHTSEDEFNMSYEDTDFDETDFQSDSEVTMPPTSMMGRQWTQGPQYLARPMTPPPSRHRAPSPSDGRDDFDSPSHYGTPPKMPRLDRQDFVSSGDWSSDGTDTRTLEPSNDHMSGSGSAPIRPGSPSPWAVPIPTPRRILGELPLEKDEFDSSSDDEMQQPPQSSNIGMDNRVHPPSLPYPTATLHTTTGNSLDGRSLMPQDENYPLSMVDMAQFRPPSSLFSPPIGASSSHPLDILANRGFSPSIHTVSSSLPNPSTISYEFDDREFDSD